MRIVCAVYGSFDLNYHQFILENSFYMENIYTKTYIKKA